MDPTGQACPAHPAIPRRLAPVLVVLVAAPLLAGCALLGPGAFYDVTVETESAGPVLVQGTPASRARIFVSLTDAQADLNASERGQPVPDNATVGPADAEPGSVVAVPANASRAIVRLPLDGQGRVTFRVPTDRDVVLVTRLVEEAPPFPVDDTECPRPHKLRSSLRRVALTEDATVELPFFVVCGASD